MSVLGLNGKNRKFSGDKANIGNLKFNKGCPQLTANSALADYVKITPGP